MVHCLKRKRETCLHFSQPQLQMKQLALSPGKAGCGQSEDAPLQGRCRVWRPGLCMLQKRCSQETTVATPMGLHCAQQVEDIPLRRQRACPLGNTKILPELDVRWVGRKGGFPCFTLKQHACLQASAFGVSLPVLHTNRSPSQLEGSCVWDGL